MIRTALYDDHVEHGGKIVDFHGFEMPLHYPNGIINEHKHVRNSVGVFDVSHMGDLVIEDQTGGQKLQRLVTNKILGIKQGKCVYTHLTDDDGIIIDDLIVSKFTDNEYLIVPNASMTDQVVRWMSNNSDLTIVNLSRELSCLAVQGPESKGILSQIMGKDIEEIKRFTMIGYDYERGVFIDIGQVKLGKSPSIGVVSRTGYTGEEGFELILPDSYASSMWKKLMGHSGIKVLPIGLGARDTLRLEMGYLLSGTDFDRDRTPLETNCSWVVKWDHDFIGKDALLRQKESGDFQKMVGFVVEGKVPVRTGGVVHIPGSPHEIVGSVSSGNHSPSMGVPIGLAYLDAGYASPDFQVEIDYRNRTVKAVTVKTPMYKKQ